MYNYQDNEHLLFNIIGMSEESAYLYCRSLRYEFREFNSGIGGADFKPNRVNAKVKNNKVISYTLG